MNEAKIRYTKRLLLCLSKLFRFRYLTNPFGRNHHQFGKLKIAFYIVGDAARWLRECVDCEADIEYDNQS